MDQLPSEGFWRQWDVQVLNFSLVTLLNILATLFLTAMSRYFDFTKIIDIANWEIADIYLFLGPVLASALTLVMVDSSTWLVSYDFGISNEMIIYWGVLAVTAIVQVVGNGSSVLLLGVYALIAFLVMTTAAILPLTALSSPLGLLAFVLFLLIVVIPALVDASAFFLLGSFVVLTVSLGFDSIYLMFTESEIPIATIQDLFENGLASTVIAEFEDTIESNLGTGFVHLFGTEMLQDILDDFWLHLSLHALVVAPLAVLLTVGKVAVIGVAFMLLLIGLLSGLFSGNDTTSFIFPSAVVLLYFVITDGLLFSLIDYLILSEVLREGDEIMGITIVDLSIRSLSHSFLSIEADYWGIYFLVRLYQRWTSGYYTSSQDPPEVGLELNSIGDIASLLTPDNIEEADQTMLQWFTKPVIIAVLMPLVQVLTWAFQIPFFRDMNYHIRGLPII